jgi:hypothetical protein
MLRLRLWLLLKLERRRDQERKPVEHQHAEQKHKREHAERRKPAQAEPGRLHIDDHRAADRGATPPRGGHNAEQTTAASETPSIARNPLESGEARRSAPSIGSQHKPSQAARAPQGRPECRTANGGEQDAERRTRAARQHRARQARVRVQANGKRYSPLSVRLCHGSYAHAHSHPLDY